VEGDHRPPRRILKKAVEDMALRDIIYRKNGGRRADKILACQSLWGNIFLGGQTVEPASGLKAVRAL
jgi:hypothetical protein